MPLSSDVSTGKGPSSGLVAELAALVGGRGPGVGANGVPKSSATGPARGSSTLAEILAERAGEPRYYGLEAVAAEAGRPPQTFSIDDQRTSPLLAEAAERADGGPVTDYSPPPRGLRVDAEEKTDILTEIVNEARAKGIAGRGLQGQVQQRVGMPGTEGYMQEELQGRAQEKVDRQMVKSEERAAKQGTRMLAGKGTKDIGSEGYADLTTRQRAAVDVSTLLTEAAEKGQGKALLDSLGVDTSGLSRKDMLQLGFTADDLERYAPQDESVAPDASLVTRETAREQLQDALVKSMLQTRRDPARGSTLRSVQQKVTGADKMSGATGTAREADYAAAMEALAQPANAPQRQEIVRIIKDDLGPEWPEFMAYLDTRTREARQYNLPLGAAEGVSYYSPKEFRKELGLND